MAAELGRRHPQHSEERMQDDRSPAVVSTHAGIRIELPENDPIGTEGRRPSPAPRSYVVYLYDQRLPRSSASNLDRPDQRMTRVELGISRVEDDARLENPCGVQGAKHDAVPGLDRQHGLELARKVAVQRAPLSRDLVDCH
jgi:hypothetical protein